MALNRDELKDRLDKEGLYYGMVEINQEAYIAVPCMDTTTGESFAIELKFDSSGNFLSHERID